METSKEPISVRISRLNKNIIARPECSSKVSLLNRECLLDALQILYDECSAEYLQKQDQNVADFVKKYGTPMKEIKKLRVNISDFEIKHIIGCGHFGEVHVVKEKQTGDIYAMKTIRKFDNETQKISFKEERNIMAFSTSQWLTSLQYAFQDSSYLFFVMDYHPGGDLLGLLYRQGGTLPESAAIFYLAELILALDDLHNMGYVHRDVKPDNILLDRCGHLKLADFGSAAKLDKNGLVKLGPPVGTPDYIAPEVLQCLENKNEKGSSYGISCDFWSVGILAYEITIGCPPFQGQNTPTLYSKIMNSSKNLKFPPDALLSQAYIDFIKRLVTNSETRLKGKEIKNHNLFKSTNFDSLHDQVPPFVPKIKSFEDTSNFSDVASKKRNPSMENFKKRSHFSGRNFPFLGFTFTHDPYIPNDSIHHRDFTNSNENMKIELDALRMKVSKSGDFNQEKENLERKLEEKSRKLESIEALRDKLEKDLASNIAERTALKRTLELERKERLALEKEAVDLIRGAKEKWEISEKTITNALNLEIAHQKETILHLTETNKTLEEQLQRALKTEHKNRMSLEVVQDLSRRSVVSLENRLEKITFETQESLTELQSKLVGEMHNKALLENQIANLEEINTDLKDKLKDYEKNYNKLNAQVNEAETIIKELSNHVNKLEKDVEQNEMFKSEIKKLQKQIKDDQKIIRDVQNKNESLQKQNETIHQYKTEIEELKQNIVKLNNDKKVSELEEQIQQEREKSEDLKKKLAEMECSNVKPQELREKQLQFWKLEKELSNFKIDKRILERELKTAQAEIKQLNEKNLEWEAKFNEYKKCQESALLEIASINESISIELMKYKETNISLQEQLKYEKDKTETERAFINELKNIIKEKEEKINTVENNLKVLNDDMKTLEARFKKQELDKVKMNELIEELQKEKKQFNNESEQSKREIKNINLNINALREACVLLENQVVEYEKLLNSAKDRELELKSNTEKLIADICQSRLETQEAKKQVNEQKSLKAVVEQKVKRLEEDKKCLENECNDYKMQCMDYKTFSSSLSEQLMISEEKLSNYEVEIKSLERQIEKLGSENKALKEEISDCLTNMSTLKESNYRLKYHLDDLKKDIEELVQKIKDLERDLQEKSSYYKERELKAESTINQQIKLIDFLQTKLDEQNHKKKSIAEVIFGSSKKENQPPLNLAMNYKDLECQLTKEREQTKKLKEEVFKLKAATLSEIHTNMLDKKIKLATCSGNISSKIEEPTSKRVKSPTRQRNSSNTQLVSNNSEGSGQNHNIIHATDEAKKRHAVFEGWVKIPCSKARTWNKRYARLTESSLDVFNLNPKEPSSSLLESFQLTSDDSYGKMISEPLISEIDIPVAASDLPFILKIEVCPNTTCWPSKSMTLMVSSAKEKDDWIKALQNSMVLKQENTKFGTILELPNDLVVNCIVDLTEAIKLLGTDKGLYSYYENKLCFIDGLKKIEQIVLFAPCNAVLMIAGLKAELVLCDINHIINLAQCGPSIRPFLKHKVINIKNLNGFHIIQVSKHSQQVKIAVAISKQLIILEYSFDTTEFIPIWAFDTAQPTSCLLFTEHSLIVGADKFFEIDLNSFKAEEFLDVSDTKLKQVLKCYKIGSFPISILEISNNPKEYLVSFNEFSVFVDEYGRSSRQKELKSNHIPLALQLIKNYLYIIQFAAVEVLKITENSCNSDFLEPYRLDMLRFRYIGSNRKGVFLEQDHRILFLNARNLPDYDAASIISTETGSDAENDSNDSRFSFTSSIVQSLDGHLSDSANSDRSQTMKRKVKFDQTDL
ncbi:citron Rho-interacting kinase [Sitophilus oryzae]|uniref:non-specific serine/threonine protein kinase n=1 Tax=Sitophilus oryzae TaxID=7048 RepID=A0A6J2YLX0_SITOR|nr:citron Rho-interacting kinase [Sitophilus oryzae]